MTTDKPSVNPAYRTFEQFLDAIAECGAFYRFGEGDKKDCISCGIQDYTDITEYLRKAYDKLYGNIEVPGPNPNDIVIRISRDIWHTDDAKRRSTIEAIVKQLRAEANVPEQGPSNTPVDEVPTLRISISGPPGSGKSQLADLIESDLSYIFSTTNESMPYDVDTLAQRWVTLRQTLDKAGVKRMELSAGEDKRVIW